MRLKSSNVDGTFKKIIKINSVLFFIIILFSVLFTSSRIYKNMATEIIKANNTILEQTKQNIDLQLMTVEQYIDDYSRSQYALDYISTQSPDNMLIIENKSRIAKIVSTNSKINNIFLYTFANERVISSTGIVNSSTLFDDDFKQQLKELEYKKWLGIQLNSRSGNYQNATLRYARMLPGSKAVIILDINETLLFDAISKYRETENGIFFISDNTGTVLSHTDKTLLAKSELKKVYMKNILGEKRPTGSFEGKYENLKSIVSYNRSNYNGWYYINVIPSKNIMKPLARTILSIVIISSLLYVLSILIAYILIKMSTMPIDSFVHAVANTVRENSGGKSTDESFGDFDQLETLFENMIYQQKETEIKLQSSYEAIKWRIVMDLVLGFTDDYEKSFMSLELTHTSLFPENFVVMIFEICNKNEYKNDGKTKEMSIICNAVKAEAERLMNCDTKGCIVNNVGGTMISLLSFDSADENKNTIIALSIAENILSFAKKHFNCNAWIGIGNIYKDKKDIKRSYADAVYAMKYKLINGSGGILFIDDFDAENNISFSAVFKKMETVVSSLQELSDDAICDSVTKIINDISSNIVTTDTFKQLALHFIMLVTSHYTILSKAENNNQSFINTHDLIEKCETVEQINTLVCQILTEMKYSITEANKESQKYSAVIAKVISYIDSNYADSSISLAQIANKFNMSAPHLSRIFKEVTSKRFIDYLIFKRMEKAKELLSTTNMKVAAVAEAVGYDTQASFMRIFKKYTGATPTSWKNNNGK